MKDGIYDESAEVYDAIYAQQGKDYEAEAVRVNDIVLRATRRAATEMDLLDVACGTGLHLEHFAKWYRSVEGLDISEAMLAVARKRLPDVRFHQGSMTSFVLNPADPALEPKFDAVTCLFSAIGHLYTRDMLGNGVHAMASHVKRGGVVIIEPWIHPDKFDPHKGDGLEFVNRDDLQVARFATVRREDHLTYLRLDYAVKHPGQFVETFAEDHIIAMWSEDDFRHAFLGTGMDVNFYSAGLSGNDRGVYVATKPA